jgi:glutaminyl-peptide cyclotransferase
VKFAFLAAADCSGRSCFDATSAASLSLGAAFTIDFGMKYSNHFALVLVFAFTVLLSACGKSEQQKASASSAEMTPAAASAPPTPVPKAVTTAAASSDPKPNINGNHVMQYVKEVVAIGSRPVGSPGHAKTEQYILSHLKGVDVEQDKFNAQTPVGKFPVDNIIAKFPGRKDGIIVVAGHYDTNYPLPKAYVGANDGGSSTALLLALADEFRGKERDGYSIWLVWTDAEEAFVTWTDTDSLYGAKHLAQKWQQDGTAKKIKAFILVDMIGDADLDIQKEALSTPWLSDLVYQAATNLGYQSHFYEVRTEIQDDHLPFLKIGVPSVDIIDLDYGYNNVYHHTVQDTLDKLSPQSLAIAGDVVLETIRLLDAR